MCFNPTATYRDIKPALIMDMAGRVYTVTGPFVMGFKNYEEFGRQRCRGRVRVGVILDCSLLYLHS